MPSGHGEDNYLAHRRCLMGEREVPIDELAKNVHQRAVGAQDVQALARLGSFIHEDLRLPSRIKVHSAPRTLEPQEAQDRLERLRSGRGAKRHGAIVVLGSPVVNPFAAALAHAAYDGDPERLPARFRWSLSPDTRHGFLSDRQACKTTDEGIWLPDERRPGFPRERDDDIVKAIQSDERKGFLDCGMLLLDVRKRPWLILAAGYGGVGTIASIIALTRQEDIATLLDDGLGFAIVGTRRRKPSEPRIEGPEVDDLEIESERFGNRHGGWWFEWPPEIGDRHEDGDEDQDARSVVSRTGAAERSVGTR